MQRRTSGCSFFIVSTRKSAKAKEKGIFADNLADADDPQIGDIIDDIDAGVFHPFTAHAEQFDIRRKLFQSSCQIGAVEVA